MKRTLSMVLALLMLAATALTSCSESTSNAETTAGTDAGTPVAGEETVEETEETRATANVPADANFDGYTFTIHCSSNSEYGIIQNDFAAEELTGEAINDAKFNRNVAVGDKLNVKIVTMEASAAGEGNGYNEINRDVTAGTASFDVATACGYSTSKLSMNNFLMDICEVPYIDLEAEWWDQVANKDLKVLDQLFYTTGDITISDNDATYCIMFNKNLIPSTIWKTPMKWLKTAPGPLTSSSPWHRQFPSTSTATASSTPTTVTAFSYGTIP